MIVKTDDRHITLLHNENYKKKNQKGHITATRLELDALKYKK